MEQVSWLRRASGAMGKKARSFPRTFREVLPHRARSAKGCGPRRGDLTQDRTVQVPGFLLSSLSQAAALRDGKAKSRRPETSRATCQYSAQPIISGFPSVHVHNGMELRRRPSRAPDPPGRCPQATPHFDCVLGASLCGCGACALSCSRHDSAGFWSQPVWV